MQVPRAKSFRKNLLSVFSLLCILLSVATGQSDSSVYNQKSRFDKLYGPDPALYNGIRYVPDHPNSKGFPFLLKNEPFDGEIILSGKKYQHLKLQYNCFKQEFVLDFLDQNNAYNALIINSNNIDTVILDGQIFVPCKIPGIQEPFLQLICSGPIKCFLTWNKEFNFLGTGAQTGFEYSNDIRKIYIQKKDGSPMRVINKQSFLNIFDKSLKRKIKSYMSARKIRFKNITDEKLFLLMEYCNSQTAR